MSASSPAPASKHLLTNKAYDILKPLATTVLPASGALYYALAQVWHWPHAEDVVGSIAAVNTFLGVVLGLAALTYVKSGAQYDGVLDVEVNPETGRPVITGMVNDQDPAVIAGMKQVTFKVNNPNV
jgi:hypothetical protein